MRLASLVVLAKKMAQVTVGMLQKIVHYDIDVGDLPKETFMKIVPLEFSIVFSMQVVDEMNQCSNATVSSDGTSRDGEKVVNFEVTVDKNMTRTFGINTGSQRRC